MNEKLVKINDLNSQLQQKAVRDFARFYIRLFKHENLEIVANATAGHFLVDINAVIDRNRNIDLVELLAKSSTLSFNQYVQVLKKIDQGYFETGNAEIPWDQWEKQQQSKLATA
ncbi:hypothetical protein [Paucilactobacillus wasatchensis]|uniref:Uncharacterized protein n=1 Tax=Paucilactobacillus wasatchensis TaxID=1335616 RepID=A0A0D0Y4W9_9LACO|nr:hypothetical protein [Paucilactobacillus wasatchensis]KIS03333.1 hypothetical protein WDC_1090 [Paucilactobacillus wasatchensis]